MEVIVANPDTHPPPPPDTSDFPKIMGMCMRKPIDRQVEAVATPEPEPSGAAYISAPVTSSSPWCQRSGTF